MSISVHRTPISRKEKLPWWDHVRPKGQWELNQEGHGDTGREISRDKTSMTTTTLESKYLGVLSPNCLPSQLTLPLVTHERGYSVWASLWLWVYNGLKVPISESNRTHLENCFGKEIQNFNPWQGLCLSGYLGQGERARFRETSRLCVVSIAMWTIQ